MYLFHKLKNVTSLYCENTYNSNFIVAFNYFRKTLHGSCLTEFWICLGFWIYKRPEYAGVWIYQACEYTRVLNMILILNMSGFWIYHGCNMPGLHMILNKPDYAWRYFNLSKWLVLHLPIVIPCLKPWRKYMRQALVFMWNSAIR